MNKYKFIVLLFSISFIFTGCENDDRELDMGTDSLIPLNIMIGGNEDFDDVSSSATRSAGAIQRFVQPLDSTKDTGIDIVTTVEMLPVEGTMQTRAGMNTNSRFRMVIYNSAGNQVADNQYQVNGTTATLVTGTAPMLVPGTYKFVSYTYNQSTLSSLGDVANVNNQDDFATYCVTKTISISDNTITVNFKRQMSLFELAVGATGFSNNTATYSSASVTNLNTAGTWNINNGSSDETGLTISDAVTSINCSSNIQYKIIPVSRTLTISFADVSVGGASYGARSVSVPVNFVRKGNYKITVQFTSTKNLDYIEIGGVQWAKGNLYKGLIAASQNMSGDGTMNSGYYYNWNSNDPFLRAVKYSSWSDLREPCPAGWHTPSVNEFKSLIDADKCVGTYDGKPGMYFGTSTPPSAQDRDSYVFLPLNAFIYFDGTMIRWASAYWSRELSFSGRPEAYSIAIYEDSFRGLASDPTNTGAFVRCVKSK